MLSTIKAYTLSFLSLVLIVILAGPMSVSAESVDDDEVEDDEPVLISEILTRTEDSAFEEFVELYNPNDFEIDISSWRLEYMSSSGSSWSSKIRGEQHVEPNMVIEPKGFYVLATENYHDAYPDQTVDRTLSSGSAEGGGHLRLLRPSEEIEDEWIVLDLVGWGSAENIWEDTEPADVPPRGASITRCFEDDAIVNTDNNYLDFVVNEHPMPGEGVDCPEQDGVEDDDEHESGEGSEEDNGEKDDSSGEESDESEESEGSDGTPIACENVIISELLPNPEGPRSNYPREDHAFIELFNPTEDFIPLDNCGLQTSANDNIHWFEDIELEPGEYRAFYERDTGIMLPVGVGGTVYLLSTDETELDSVTYSENSPEGASWSWFGNGDWRYSYSPSPNEVNIEQDLRPCPGENQERNPETNRCRTIEDEGDEFEPCGPGRERNPETNRCRSVESASAQLTPCGPGRERNPETNRCRNIDSGEPDYVPCGPNQERNPETNRCRLVESASSSLEPCGPGRERNPETNRCRRIAVANSSAINSVEDVNVVSTGAPTNWWLAGVVGFIAILYGAWEWRYDIANVYRRLRKRD